MERRVVVPFFKLQFTGHKKEEEIGPYQLAKELEEIIIDALTGGEFDEEAFQKLKMEFVKNPDTWERLPEVVKDFNSLREIFKYVQPMFKENKYKNRRKFIEKQFEPFLEYLKESGVDEVRKKLIIDEKYIEKSWKRAQKQLKKAPDEALEISYILLEDTARYILDDLDLNYREEELPPFALMEIVMDKITLSSEPVIEESFKQGFLFLARVVEQVKGKIKSDSPEFQMDAEVVVNIIGTSCLYLYKKYQFMKGKGS